MQESSVHSILFRISNTRQESMEAAHLLSQINFRTINNKAFKPGEVVYDLPHK